MLAQPMSALDPHRQELDAARAALLAQLDGLPADAFARRPPASDDDGDLRWSIRELLWHVGDAERCWREWAEGALRGEAITRFRGHRRPAQLNRVPQLRDWIEDNRAATRAFVDGLDEMTPTPLHATPPRERSIVDMLDYLADHDREHAAQVAALRMLPETEER